ncbi:SDR family NAD(P)-dependent oxidoreductase [Baekduia sp. Peel2402]|uniref:SDR family NAD(P)-dependent oxidoreductase n=1 Tax=Baekduia sp. Peel2402 TaxID=3458296 RepID=UPI00403E5EB1
MSTFLITGASTGIGAAIAKRLLEDGHQVFAGVEQRGVTGELPEPSDGLHVVELDVSSEASVAAAAAEAERILGPGHGLDGIVNNAGVGFPGPLEALPLDALRRQLEVNVVGQVATTQAFLPLIREGAPGRVLFVGSVGGILASQFAGAYHASKFAIEAIGDVWRQELEPEGIDVVLIEPSAISTPIWTKAIASLDELERDGSPRLLRYRERLAGFRDSLRSADEHGKSADDVAGAIAEALTAEKPDTRYVVGASGRIATALRPLIPDRLADKLGQQTG